MPNEKRSRGRPRGSGKNDTAMLAQVADLVTKQPALKPTTAMKRVIASAKERDATPETLLRRLQVKWRAQGASLLAQAKARATPKPAAMGGGYAGYGYGYGYGPTLSSVDRLIFEQQRMMDLLNPPGLRHMRETMEAAQRLQDFIDPPALRHTRELMERMQRFQDMVDPPALRHLRGRPFGL